MNRITHIAKQPLRMTRHFLQFFTGGLLLFVMNLHAVNAQNPNFQVLALDLSPSLTYDDLWNLNIVVSGSHTFNSFFIVTDVSETSIGSVLSATTSSFMANSGVTTFNSQNYHLSLQPVVNFNSGGSFSSILQNGGYFPAGDYVISYRLFGKATDIMTGEVTEFLAEYSFQKNVGAFFPPILLEPSNESVFYYNLTNQLFFGWTPVFAQNCGDQLTYVLSVFQIMPGQSPEQSVMSNPAVFIENNLPATFFNYPVVAQSFYDSCSYAWHIRTFCGSSMIAESEVWRFEFTNVLEMATPLISHQNPSKYYFRLQENLHDNFAFDITLDSLGDKRNVLRFVFTEDYFIDDTFALQYMIFDNNYSKLQEIPNETVKYHDNVYEIDFDQLELEYGYYILEVKNQKNQKLYIRFLNSEE